MSRYGGGGSSGASDCKLYVGDLAILTMSRYGGGGSSGASDCKLYVGDLGSNASKQELEEAFSYYGPLRNVWVARNPPGFAFVEFEEPRDAEDAIRGLDGSKSSSSTRTVCGRRVRVEMSTGMSKSRYPGPMSRNRGRPFDPQDRCYECGERGHYARDCSRYSRRGSGGGGGRRRSAHLRLPSAGRTHALALVAGTAAAARALGRGPGPAPGRGPGAAPNARPVAAPVAPSLAAAKLCAAADAAG
ncbi:hypothetical protein B566_EDAN007524 [Ephemera danica]|nr:hypothetical protein B566_EDAN007524 [Ephemera danica]